VVTLFASVNNLSQAEEKSTVAGMMLADNAGRISTKQELDDEGLSDIKSRYSAEEVEIGNEPGSKRVKRNRKNAARQAAKGKGKTNNVFEADRETRDDLKVGSIEFSNLKELSPDYLLSKITVKSLDEGYGIDYNQDKLTIHTSYNKKIISVIEYVKDSILEGKSIKLVSRLISENNNFQNISETTLSDEEKTLLIEKIKNLEQTRYQEIMTKYDEQTKNIENLIKTVYDRKAGLEQIQRELISLNTMINLPETSGTSVSTESPLSSETPEEAGMSSVLADEIKDCYVNSFCSLFRFNSLSDKNIYFYGYLLRHHTIREYFRKIAQGSTRFNLSKESFKNLSLLVSKLGEQQKIADCLLSLDEKIAVETEQVVQLQQHKKGLLQQLLV